MNNRTTKQAVACTKTATLRGKLTDGITMAKRLLVAVALAVAFFSSAYAQQQVAVLQRGDSVLGVYYGVNSFIDAMNASANGDIITLSGGTFNSPTYENPLSKAITIRGAGAMADTARGITPTVFYGEYFYCNSIAGNNNTHLVVEGVLFNGYLYEKENNATITSPEFIRCIFMREANSAPNKTDGTYVNCIFKGSVSTNHGYNGGNFVNCVLWDDTESNSTINLVNCVVRVTFYQNNLNANNTIFFRENSSSDHTLNAGNIQNSLVIGLSLSNIYNSTNTVLPLDSLSAVFATFTNSSNNIDFNTSYALTSRAAASFLGIDGTQVGIYGGVMPFNFVPTYNVIRRCTVAPRSTADGKLSVDIELETEDGE